MAKAYEAKAAEFKAKYGIELDIGAMYDFNKKASYLDDFVFNTNPQEKGRKLYMDTLVQALSDRIEKISKIQTGSLYMTLNVSFGEFIEDFDQLMQVKFADDAADERIPNTHTPFEGSNYREIAKTVMGRLREYDKPISDVWASKIAKGKMTLEDIQAVVDPARTRMNNSLGADWGTSEKSDYINALMAKRALDMAMEKRSGWWRVWPGNWGTWYRERQYAKALEENLMTYNLWNHSLSEVELSALNEKSMLSFSKNNLNSFLNEKAAANETAPARVETFYDNGRDERENVLGELNDDALEEYFDKEAAAEDAYLDNAARKSERDRIKEENMIKGAAYSADSVAEARRVVMKKPTVEFMQKRFVDLMVNCEKEYDDRARKAGSIYTVLGTMIIDTWRDNKNMASTAIGMFKEAYHLLRNDTQGMSEVDKLVAAQKMTNLMINLLSPVVRKPELEGFGENYAMDNLDNADIKKITGYEGDVTELVNAAREELGMEKLQVEEKVGNEPLKEPVAIPELSEKDGKEEISSKVDEIESLSKEKSIN